MPLPASRIAANEHHAGTSGTMLSIKMVLMGNVKDFGCKANFATAVYVEYFINLILELSIVKVFLILCNSY